jgi:small subunit ribosomal protein S16
MLRIRLRRVGKKGNPSYRIVVADSRAPRDGAYLEWIGNYDPMGDPPSISLKEDRAVQWLSKGAQPSDAVKRILDRNGIIQRTPLMKTRIRSSAAQATPAVTTKAAAATPAAVVEVAEAVEEEAAVDEAAANGTSEEASKE